jgi:hypothetical protein
MYNVYIKDLRTGARYVTETAPYAYSADRKAMRLLRQLDADHIAYCEPADGWDAEGARAAQIAAEWEAWRKANGFEQRATDGGVKNG